MLSDAAIESLASLCHDIWTAWSRNMASLEKISVERLASWQRQWLPYEQLDPADKELDRLIARKIAEHLDKWAVNNGA